MNKLLCQHKYRENVKEYFDKYKNHKVIKLYNTLCNDILDISAFLNMALCYSNPPKLENIASYENNFGSISNTAFPFEEFINALRRFYIDTDFEIFYKNNQSEYSQMLNNYGNKEKLSVNTIEKYLSSKVVNYNIILSPLVMGNFGIKMKITDKEIMQYSIISPYDYTGNNYIFGPINFIKSVLWHEICHLTINDLTKKYINYFNIDKIKVPEIFVSNLYTTIETIINEYIIRAIVLRMFEINGELEFMDNLIKIDIDKGFKDIEKIKSFIIENCEYNGELIKSNKYQNLIEYILNYL
jgi:hypothetical protein